MSNQQRQRFVDFMAKYSKDDRYQHMLDLDDEFPTVEMFGDQCTSAQIGPGWVGLIRPCLELLRDAGCKVSQIKQKFGGLRLYWDIPPGVGLSSAVKNEINAAISYAETTSYSVCEKCSCSINPPRAPGYITLCDACE